jgi:hypothetical protein
MNTPSHLSPAGSRRRSLTLGSLLALVVIGLVAVTALVFSGPGADRDTAAPEQTASPTSIAPPPALAAAPVTPEPTGPTGDADELPPSLPAVALDQPAAVGNGITAEVASLEAIDGSGRGPGNVSGPALRATVRITNGTADPVSLEGVAVDLGHGPELMPASPLDDPSASPFSGVVQPSESAVGVYVFSVPADDRDVVRLSVGYQAGAPFLVFSGSAR